MKQDIRSMVSIFFENISSGKIEEAFTVVADDVRWWVPEELPFSGVKNKAQYMEIARRIQNGFPTGFKLSVKSMLVENNKAAVEVESEGTHLNGKSYRNKYHFLIESDGEKWISVKEYMNTLHLAKLLG